MIANTFFKNCQQIHNVLYALSHLGLLDWEAGDESKDRFLATLSDLEDANKPVE